MKRLTALFLSMVMMLAFPAGCAAPSATPSPSAGEETLFTPGKFTGEGEGYGGTIVMEVEVDASRILSITPVEHKETPGVSDPAFERIPQAIIDSQSLNVDAVAGATMASNGILEAVSAALAKTAKDMGKLQDGGGKDSAAGK